MAPASRPAGARSMRACRPRDGRPEVPGEVFCSSPSRGPRRSPATLAGRRFRASPPCVPPRVMPREFPWSLSREEERHEEASVALAAASLLGPGGAMAKASQHSLLQAARRSPPVDERHRHRRRVRRAWACCPRRCWGSSWGTGSQNNVSESLARAAWPARWRQDDGYADVRLTSCRASSLRKWFGGYGSPGLSGAAARAFEPEESNPALRGGLEANIGAFNLGAASSTTSCSTASTRAATA